VEVDLRRLCHLVSFTANQCCCKAATDSPRNEHDQELDSVLVGPIPIGINKFQFSAQPPDLSRIPNSEIIGVTVVLLSCSYDEREFVRVGYYVNNEYTDEALQLEPPAKPIIEKVRRNILAEKPRVTRFAIKWYDSRIPYGPGNSFR
jgi:histone chaperone ASF1